MPSKATCLLENSQKSALYGYYTVILVAIQRLRIADRASDCRQRRCIFQNPCGPTPRCANFAEVSSRVIWHGKLSSDLTIEEYP